MHRSQPISPREVAIYLGIELVVVEHTVERHEHRVDLHSQLVRLRGDIFRVVTVNEHSSASLPLTDGASFYRRLRRELPFISGLSSLYRTTKLY